MAQQICKLSARRLDSIREPGLYGDGLGLYLQVTLAGVRSWLFRYTIGGRTRAMGLGPLHIVSLADARTAATALRRQLHAGVDPLQARDAADRERAAMTARSMTFKEAAEAYIAAHESGWRNAKHGDQWRNTLTTYAFPTIGALDVNAVDTPLTLKVLEPIWATKTETASRVRGRIEAVLDWAAARRLRTGENPARWKGHLDKLLPKKAKVARVEHHAALPWPDLPAFMSDLRGQVGVGAMGLEFQILTAARTGEVIGATWAEIDLENRLWVIPGERMKAGREHRVPLSDAALTVLRRVREMGREPWVFPGLKDKKPLSNMAFLKLLERMKRADVTPHGFRSTFRDWGAESTAHPSEVLDMALAHTVSDKVEAAYRRGDLFEKRRQLMADWAAYGSSHRE